MHSADMCCSLMASIIEDTDGVTPLGVLDAAHGSTHFGPGGRDRPLALRDDIATDFETMAESHPKLMAAARDRMRSHLGTQGDGNHFLFVGRLESTGQNVLVTHHGSRGVGASVYKAGMKIAERFRQTLSPDTLKANAWIPFETEEGRAYWRALQLVRRWTKANHEAIHERTLSSLNVAVAERHWNEHNSVFRDEATDVFWHAKGATPIHAPFLPDTTGVQIVPLSMAEPILFIRGERTTQNLGFAPHGAGRNMSRTKHVKATLTDGRTEQSVFDEETADLDVRFYSGKIDVSELPSAYKDAARVQADMKRFELADVVDRVIPYGSIMAGDWERDAPWRNKRRKAG